jgi:ACS family glucarate transporter-like MFS transporter
MQDIGGRNTAAVAGWGNMWGNYGAALSSIMVPKLLKWGQQLSVGDAGVTGQTIVFLACSSAFFLSAVLALGMNPTKRIVVG